MIRFLSGIAVGWVMARDPPTSQDLKDSIRRFKEILENIVPKDEK